MKRLRLLLAIAGALVLAMPAGGAYAAADRPISAAASALAPRADGSICYRAHVQNIGWQDWVCNGSIAGTVGQALRLEALDLRAYGVGYICVAAHVEGIGWMNVNCGGDGAVVSVGTTGMSLRLEALTINVAVGTVCANAHVQNIGWQGYHCGSNVMVGTTGQSLRMEAVSIYV